MKKYVLILLLGFFTQTLAAQSLYFPPLTGNTWDTISPSSLGWCPEKIDALLDYLEVKNSKAFIILKDGKIVIEKYFGTFTQDSVWYWASAGKTLTSFMVGIAQQENFLSISDTTSDYLGTGWTVCTPAQEEKITIRHQLTMTTGLDDGVADHYCTLDTCLQYLADPGTRWAYHNGPYTLLDGVISDATGQTLNAYTAQKLMMPTGISGAFITNGYNHVFYSKPRSMARFGLLMLNKGIWNGNPVMTDTSYFNQMVNTSQSLNKSYGYLWWLNGKPSYMLPSVQFVFPGPLSPHAPMDMIAALGKNGQVINVVPSQNLVFIRMGNAPDAGEVPVNFNDSIWVKVNDLACNAGTEENKLPGIKVYPNPASGNSVVELAGTSFDMTISDMTGKVVMVKKDCFDKAYLDLGSYANGTYFIRINAAGFSPVVRKLVISR